jgi:hypothetical protein
MSSRDLKQPIVVELCIRPQPAVTCRTYRCHVVRPLDFVRSTV